MGNKSSRESTRETNGTRPSSGTWRERDPAREAAVEAEGDEEGSENSGSQSYYSMIKSSYNALVNAIIRPPRCEYDISKLGPPAFAFCGRRFVRRDFVLTNARGLKICCSMWEPQAAERPAALLPCVIYMHGNSSARLEALSSLSLVLSLGATLLAFDFAGSGMSEGEYVSLGYFEKDDLGCVIEHLRQGTTSTIALWGRSMGASTALLHGERDPSIASMVLDSAFHSLVMLAEEMVEMGRQQGLFAPGILVRMVLSFVRSSVQKAANFDIRLLRPIDSVDKCFVPALFVAALNDHFVSQKHSELLHAAYGGDKNLVIVDGDHNSPRPRFLYDSIGIFLATTLQIPDSWMLADCEQYIRRMPWAAPPASFQSQRRSFGLSGTFAGPARGVAENNGNGGGGGSGGSGGNGGGDAEMEAMLRMHMCEGAGAEGAAEMSLDDLMAISVLLDEEENAGGRPGQEGPGRGGPDPRFQGAPGGLAELEMQSSVQQRLFALMGGTGATGGGKGVGTSGTSADGNLGSKRAGRPFSPTNPGTPTNTDTPTPTASPTDTTSETWACVVCSVTNVAQLSCAACGTSRR